MKKIIFAAIFAAAFSVSAMTEDELVKAAGASQDEVRSGKLSELDHYKYVHKLVSEMPSSYKFKAENLRIFGGKIDILEAVAAGKITQEKGRRDMAQQDADYESEVAARENAARQRFEAARSQERMRNEAMAAEQEAQRRALAIQMLQNRPAPPQLRPYQMPMPTRCRSVAGYGGVVDTVCN